MGEIATECLGVCSEARREEDVCGSVRVSISLAVWELVSSLVEY